MTLRLAIRSGAIVLAVTLAVGADAQLYGRYDKAMVAGGTLQLGHFANVNGDCTSGGSVTVRVVSGPSSGAIRMAQNVGYGHFGGDYQQCNAVKVMGESVIYTPQRGFTGTDSVQLDVFYPNGVERVVTFTITVK
jgi:hypothetical protein